MQSAESVRTLRAELLAVKKALDDAQKELAQKRKEHDSAKVRVSGLTYTSCACYPYDADSTGLT